MSILMFDVNTCLSMRTAQLPPDWQLDKQGDLFKAATVCMQVFYCFFFFAKKQNLIVECHGAGGGITERNLQRILEGSGAQEFHCSARSTKDSAMKFRYHAECWSSCFHNVMSHHAFSRLFLLLDRNSSVSMGASLTAPEYSLKVADVGKVRTLNAIAKNTL